jgi:DNA polymerase-3 subunit alpha
MGKKKAEEMAEHRDLIARARRRRATTTELANSCFDLMAKFAEYGFNKSHTAAYAVVTYHTAWLKAHHCAASSWRRPVVGHGRHRHGEDLP